MLGKIGVARDGGWSSLPGKQAKALAILVAARRPVGRFALIDGIWGSGHESNADPVSPIMSRLREQLAPCGLRITDAKETGTYRLVGATPGRLAQAVDAYRFEELVRQVREVLTRSGAGGVDTALDLLRTAGSLWTGPPCTVQGEEWFGPDVCGRFRRRLDHARSDLVQRIAQAVLLEGAYHHAPAVLDSPLGAGHRDDAALWLLRWSAVLHRDGVPAARQAIAARRRRTRYDDVIERADGLAALRACGVEVHRPVPAPPGPPDAGSPAHLICRSGELAALASFVDRVGAGDPGLSTVVGVAGVGKTRLLREVQRARPGPGPLLVEITCDGSTGVLQPWQVLAGRLWSRALRDLSTGRTALTGVVRAALTGFVAAVAPAPVRAGGEHAPAQLIAALCALLREAAQGGGLVVLFDNAELLSQPAVALLHEVRAGLGAAAAGFVLAGRPGSWQAEVDAAETVEPVAAGRTAVRLAPLDPEGVQAWLTATTGKQPTEEQLAEAVRRTGGRPLLLRGATVTSDGVLVYGGPQLGGPDREPSPWLAAAAVSGVGTAIDATLVAQVLDEHPAALDRQLAEAATTGAVVLGGPAGQPLRFASDVWREDVLSRLERHPALARRLHLRTAELLAARTTAWPDPALAVRVARHALAATTAGEPSPAWLAGAYLDAARAELAGYAPRAARAWAEHGLTADAPQDVRVGLLLTLGEALGDEGDVAGAARSYREAHRAAAGLPRLRAVAAIQLARQWSDPGQADTALIRLLAEARRGLAGSADPGAVALRLQLSAHVAHKSRMAVSPGAGPDVPDEDLGAGLAARTVAELRPEHGPAVACEVLTECRWGGYDDEPPARALGLAERLYDAAIAAESAYFSSEALVALVIDHVRLGGLSRAARLAEEHRQHLARHPRMLGDWLQDTMDTMLDLWAGRFDRARQRLLGRSRETVDKLRAQAVPVGAVQQTWDGQYFWLMHELGRMPELAAAGVAERVQQQGFFPIWRAGQVLAASNVGHGAAALAEMCAMADDTAGFTALPPHGYTVATLVLLAEACAKLDRTGEAGPVPAGVLGALRAGLAPHHDEIALAGWPTVLVGPVARAEGLLALLAGDPDAALGHFTDARIVVGAGAYPQQARLAFDRARALRATGADAAESARTALREAVRLGMNGLARDIGAV